MPIANIDADFGVKIEPYNPSQELMKQGIESFTAFINQRPVLQIEFFNNSYHVYGIRGVDSTGFLDTWESILGSLGQEAGNLDSIDYLITSETKEVRGKTIKFVSRRDLEKIIGQNNDAIYINFKSSAAELWGDIKDVLQQSPRVGVALRQAFLPNQYNFIKHLTNNPLTEEQIDYICQFLANKAVEKYTTIQNS